MKYRTRYCTLRNEPVSRARFKSIDSKDRWSRSSKSMESVALWTGVFALLSLGGPKNARTKIVKITFFVLFWTLFLGMMFETLFLWTLFFVTGCFVSGGPFRARGTCSLELSYRWTGRVYLSDLSILQYLSIIQYLSIYNICQFYKGTVYSIVSKHKNILNKTLILNLNTNGCFDQIHIA